MKKTAAEAPLVFHWSYILLPLVILLLSIILTVYFYHLLPAEVAYRVKSDGSPDRWVSRGVIVLWMLIPQLFLTLLAVAATWGVTRVGARYLQPGSTGIKPEKIFLVMSNMIALPQSIFCFAMLDIFSYNSYQIHLLPLWVFALIVMVVGGVILGIFFLQTIRQVWEVSKE